MKRKEDKRKKDNGKRDSLESSKKDEKVMETSRDEKFDKLVQQNLFFQRRHE
ncbi:hypothetical protein [Methylacidiphilum caldifontis]|uniref:hypothetical protein n=1 Tax=Methylacidiphilum caldifontis TaxID=2795386 RepID=UPI00141B1C38|nr:hypothetical protein [Methylacidiphilum caldifontis]